jgi:hypothetical protein
MIMMTGASVSWEEAVTPAAKRCTVIASRKGSGWESEISVITVCQWMCSAEVVAWRPSLGLTRPHCSLAQGSELRELRGELDKTGDLGATLCKAGRTYPHHLFTTRSSADVCWIVSGLRHVVLRWFADVLQCPLIATEARPGPVDHRH